MDHASLVMMLKPKSRSAKLVNSGSILPLSITAKSYVRSLEHICMAIASISKAYTRPWSQKPKATDLD